MKKLLILSIIINVAAGVFFLVKEEDVFNRLYFSLKRKGMIDKKVDLSVVKEDSTMILLTLGQSNAANSGDSLYQVHNKGKVLNYYKGHVYLAADPLLGADGSGGSVWGILGDMIVDSGLYRKVVIIPIGIGATTIDCWAAGECHDKLENTLQDLKKDGIRLTHILYHQGESENGTMNKIEYKKRLLKIWETFKKYNQDAPFYVAQTSYNKYVFENNGIDTTIQKAQLEFALENQGVFAGPNTDTIASASDRFDGQHFSKFGMLKCAKGWYNAVSAYKVE